MSTSSSPTSPSTSISSTSTSTSTSSGSELVNVRRKPRVSAEHTLNRVRENQRRHRARQKDHVATLELRLAETERQLAAAQAEIERLRQERDVANAFVCLDVSRHFERLDSTVAMGMGAGVYATPEELLPDSLGVAGDEAAAALLATSLPFSPVSVPVSSEQLEAEPRAGPPPCCTDDTLPSPALTTPLIQDSTSGSAQCTSCATRPPPSPSESTTLCAQAFVLISQRNVRNLDPALIRLWLSRGYRRAMREGEGCRVEDGTLRGLLEYISGV